MGIKFRDIKIGDNNIEFNALVVDCKTKQTVNQTPYYGLTLSDGDINVDARIWQVNMVNELELGHIENGSVYSFSAKVNEYAGKPQIIITSIKDAPKDSVDWNKYYRSAPLSEKDLRDGIKAYIYKVNNSVLKSIVIKLIGDNADKFFTYPAAVTFHHNYLSGLAYHVYSMLRLADSYLLNYPNLNSDILYSGVLIHDIGKTIEFTQAKQPEYSQSGNLLGHIVIGLEMLSDVAKELMFKETEEYFILQHMIASHHGELEFGSPKEPLIAEALALYLMDLTDSKLAPINEEIGKTEKGHFTNSIPTVNKKSLYVPKI